MFRNQNCDSRNHLKEGLENKVEKYLPERRVKEQKDGIWEIENL